MGTWNIILYRKGGTLTPLPPLGIDEFPLISSGSNTLPLDVYPNPFSNSTTFQLESTEPGIAEMQITDLTGRVVYKKEAVRLQKGRNQISWSAESLPGGIYFCRVQLGNKVYTAKIIHLQ
ncbi:MAG: T9SS type A sorting domain-containing protein [Bacteroidales bacterium]